MKAAITKATVVKKPNVFCILTSEEYIFVVGSRGRASFACFSVSTLVLPFCCCGVAGERQQRVSLFREQALGTSGWSTCGCCEVSNGERVRELQMHCAVDGLNLRPDRYAIIGELNAGNIGVRVV